MSKTATSSRLAFVRISKAIRHAERNGRTDPAIHYRDDVEVLVHGNFGSAFQWYTTVWRFESNGYDPKLLFAMDFPLSTARADDAKPQPSRSGTVDQVADLSAMVARVLLTTGQDKVVLVGHSRAGNTIRNYIKFAGGHANVTLAILAAAPSHGIFADPNGRLTSEFNGRGNYITRLNEGSEVYPGIRFFTLRSDKQDLWAQPSGEFIGMPGQATNVNYDGPELKDATNIVLPGLDHSEVAFHPKAFTAMYRAITGREPKTLEIFPEEHPVLDGIVGTFADGVFTNLPLSGANLSVFEVNRETGERIGDAKYQATTGPTGRWGPFKADPGAYYEFVIASAGAPTNHVYHTPFPRSSPYINFFALPADPKLKDAGCVLRVSRPHGYFGLGRDTFTIDGKVPDGMRPGVPSVFAATMTFPASAQRAVPVVLNDERLTVRTEPQANGHLVFARFHY